VKVGDIVVWGSDVNTDVVFNGRRCPNIVLILNTNTRWPGSLVFDFYGKNQTFFVSNCHLHKLRS
jgi:hypothetical protein